MTTVPSGAAQAPESIGGVSTRPLRDDELHLAVDLVAAAIPEVPLFSWLIGEHADDWETVECLSVALIGAHVPRGRVQSAFGDDGTLLGIVVWSPHDDLEPPLTDAVVEAARAILPKRPAVLERMALLKEATARHRPPGDHAEVVFAVVRPQFRNTGIPALLGRPVRDAARAAGVDIVLSASDAAVGESFGQTHGALASGTFRVGDVTIHQYAGPP